jgi:DNA-binding MarR family transcriptional regulator
VESANLGVLMFVAHRSLEERAYQAAVAAGGTDVTPSQARLLARVGADGTRLVDLAAQARVTKQTAGHLVDQLEKAGYVERVPDPSDGRARLVRLTAKAEVLVPAANAEVERVLEEWRAHLGERRMRQLAEALTMLRGITDPWT